MKNLRLLFLMGMFLFSIVPVSLNANTAEPVTTPAKLPIESSQSKVFEARINEIKTMDKSKLNASEKKQLRKELRSMKRALTGGVYLSAGAIILIVLLIVLLL
jgi:hypothetical protein